MPTINKTGVVRYNVSTDTHNFPWGHRNGVNGETIHFDLGDNTTGCAAGEFDEPETMSVACMALRGNHDTICLGLGQKQRECERKVPPADADLP